MKAVQTPHALSSEDVLAAAGSSPEGLSSDEVKERLQRYGPNTLPKPRLPGVPTFFIRQFLSPLIYILLLAAAASLLLGEWSDAAFISVVLLVNASIGTAQEYSAQRSAEALRNLVHTVSRAFRDGSEAEVDAEDLVPGDVVLLESGSKVPADLRLIFSHGLQVDESLLTGESLPDSKDPGVILEVDTPLGDRDNMAFAGTLVISGRGRGVVVATGQDTEVGSLAQSLSGKAETKPPLILRMERFNSKIAMGVAAAVIVIFAVEYYRGEPLYDIFFQSVALAVAAVPEGLPVAMTIALAIGMSRMAKRNVIVRRLVAVEALGSCNYIASDKTGTLTMNQLTASRISMPGMEAWEVTGAGLSPEGSITTLHGPLSAEEKALLERLARAAALANEGFVGRKDGSWTGHGDTVDVALLVMALKAGISQQDELRSFPKIGQIPFESERQFSATLHQSPEGRMAFAKGAPEKLIRMCSSMAGPGGDRPMDSGAVEDSAGDLAASGYRILALAGGRFPDDQGFRDDNLMGLTFLGLVGMIDPLRPEARGAVEDCHSAGVQVAMVTGDHPTTALAIARELGLADDPGQVVTGSDLRAAKDAGEEKVDALVSRGRVFARVEPQQKVLITESLVRQGRIVAVTGDGANDAPALHAAHVGVAMGRGGTDVARESADLIITDDNFASIVAGIEEGRVTYSNIRKVIFFSVSTGAAELFIFILALIFNMPLPLLAVQLLWLNLVTNGIQDVSLAFEPSEGGEMDRPPRPPKEPIFNRLMVERMVIAAVTIGGLAFALYYWLLLRGWSLDDARNSTVLLMVLFENAVVFASRSETRTAFKMSPLRNPLLLFGTLAATLVHVAAMYTPWLSGVLHIHPVPLDQWEELPIMALAVFGVMELYKLIRARIWRSE